MKQSIRPLWKLLTKNLKKTNEAMDKKELTVADVIESEEFKTIVSNELKKIVDKIENAKSELKQDERLVRTIGVRLYELKMLETDNFINAYACILGKQHVDLPSALRQAIKNDGDNMLGLAYYKLTHKPNDDGRPV